MGAAGKLLVLVPTPRGTCPDLIIFSGSVSHLLILPFSPPAPGTLPGQLSGLETQEVLSSLHAGHTQQAQEDTEGRGSLSASR